MNTNKKAVKINKSCRETEVGLLECTNKPERQKNRQQDKWAERKRDRKSRQKKRRAP